MDKWFAFGAVLLVGALAGCGGGSSSDSAADPVSVAGVAEAGEAPETLVLGEVRTANFTNRLSLAWAGDGAFTGSIVAQVELGFSYLVAGSVELQHNGPPAPASPSVGSLHEFRYANGFFLLTALLDNDVNQGLPFLVDLYPPGVTPVTPSSFCEPLSLDPCYNGLGSIAFFDWPTRAGDSVNLLIRREDPAQLAYTVRVKPNEREEFRSVAVVPGELSATVERGAAWALDFPSARAQVRVCDAAGACVDSNEQPLQSALTKGVIPLRPRGDAPNAQVALSGNGNWLVVGNPFFPGGPSGVGTYVRTEEGRWLLTANVASEVPGFGRTFALSSDGTTLAVEASTCSVATVVCNDGSVIVFQRADPNSWIEQARFSGVRAPRVSADGSRMAAIAIAALRGNAVVVFARNGTAWSELAFPVLDYVPLDLELSTSGLTLAVARAGTLQNPCGCRAVVVYDTVNPGGWRQSAVLFSSKRPDAAGSPDDDGFGFAKPGAHSLALSAGGDVLAVGASLDSSDASDTVGDPANHGALNSGAVYVFARQGDGSWLKHAFLKACAATAHDHFGRHVGLSTDGRRLFGGARGLAGNATGVNRNHAADQALPTPAPGADGALIGAATYVFEHAGSAWDQRATMVAPNAATADFGTFYGLAVSADGSVVVMGTGAPDTAGAVQRTVFVY